MNIPVLTVVPCGPPIEPYGVIATLAPDLPNESTDVCLGVSGTIYIRRTQWSNEHVFENGLHQTTSYGQLNAPLHEGNPMLEFAVKELNSTEW